MQIDYYAYRSGMKHWNSGIKVLLALGTLCLILVLDDSVVSLFVILSMSTLTLRKGRIPIKIYTFWMMLPLTFMLLNAVVIAVQFAKQPMGTWNSSIYFCYLCVTKESIVRAMEVFVRGMAGVSALYMLAFSTPMYRIILVFKKLHMPELVLELMHLMYRYIFILIETQKQMQTAAKARMGYRNRGQSFRTFANIGGNLLIVSLKKANTYYDALVARGYDGVLEFLSEERPIKVGQVISCVAYFSTIIVLFALRWR